MTYHKIMKEKVERSIQYAISEVQGKKVSLDELSPMFLGYQSCPNQGNGIKYVRFYYIVHVVVDGAEEVEVGNERYIIKKGDVFIVKPYVPTEYDFKPNSKLKYAWIGFFGSYGKKLDGVPSVVQVKGNYFERIKTLVDENEIVYGEPASEILVDLIDEVLANQKNELLASVKEYIDNNFQKEILVEDLAKDFSYNRAYLSRIFKKEYGVSIKEYLLDRRLDAALNMIINGERVNDVCYKSGFTNPYNFSRYFKEKYGVPPSKYIPRNDYK
ncbi:MAG: AraC family transcriptional regulator [Clostridiales bacterium]|nr:AraC family transcriptional regulator [Clostridiales bacterium]